MNPAHPPLCSRIVFSNILTQTFSIFVLDFKVNFTIFMKLLIAIYSKFKFFNYFSFSWNKCEEHRSDFKIWFEKLRKYLPNQGVSYSQFCNQFIKGTADGRTDLQDIWHNFNAWGVITSSGYQRTTKVNPHSSAYRVKKNSLNFQISAMNWK